MFSITVLWSGKSESFKGPTGLFVSFPAKKQRDGSDRQLAYPANADRRMKMQRVILAEYEKVVGESEPMSNARPPSECLRVLEQLKTDGLINEEEYNTANLNHDPYTSHN